MVVVAFSSQARIFRDTNHSPASLPFFFFLSFFLFLLFFFLSGDQLAHQFHSFGQDQSSEARKAETNVDDRSLIGCV